MATFTLHRCDHCGQTRETKDGFVACLMAPQRIPYLGYSLNDLHPSTSIEVCSMDCFVGWANTKARDEFAQLEAHLPRPKKKKAA